jgi:hypothetical protein
MKRSERGGWIDTEGAIMARTPSRMNYEISVYQNEGTPLLDYKRGAENDGVPSFVERFYTHGRRQFRDVFEKRKRLQRVIVEARKIAKSF